MNPLATQFDSSSTLDLGRPLSKSDIADGFTLTIPGSGGEPCQLCWKDGRSGPALTSSTGVLTARATADIDHLAHVCLAHLLRTDSLQGLLKPHILEELRQRHQLRA